MKTLRLTFSFIAIVLFTCTYGWGQKILRTEATCNFNNYNMGDPVGVINGSYTYQIAIRLSKETGKIESIHWVAKDWDIVTVPDGDPVKCIDVGHDTYGELWDFFNKPNYYNSDVWGSPEITYPYTDDGWMEDLGIMPTDFPKDEGTFVAMAFKCLCKGKMIKMYCLVQIHINANGIATVDFRKWYLDAI